MGTISTAATPITCAISAAAQSAIPAPGKVERDHINVAIEASQTAIDASGALSSLSQWVLGILGVLLGVLALLGRLLIRRDEARLPNDPSPFPPADRPGDGE